MVWLAAALLVLLGGVHSVLGERYILMRLARHDRLPKLFGDSAFTMGTLRFVWHLITVAWVALAYLMLAAELGALSRGEVLRSIGITSLVSALLPLYFTQGRHLSWLVFVAIGGLLLAAAAGSH